MRDANTVRFSHFKPVYVESIKTIFLHVVNGISVWIKTVQERGKNESYSFRLGETALCMGRFIKIHFN